MIEREYQRKSFIEELLRFGVTGRHRVMMSAHSREQRGPLFPGGLVSVLRERPSAKE